MPKAEVNSVVKVQLTCNSETETVLDGHSKICNWLYNQLLEKANQMREVYKQSQDPETAKILYTERGLRNLVPGLKTSNPFLKVVHSSPLKNAALRASGAIQSYQKSRKGKRQGAQTGWPRFRSWSRAWFSLLYDEPNKGFRLNGRILKLSLGMGLDKKQRSLEMSLESVTGLAGKEVRNLRICKQLGQFYAIFTVRTIAKEAKPVQSAIALDPNHKNLAYGVGTDGQAIELQSPCWVKKTDKRIDELMAKRDRCVRHSQKKYKDESQDSFYFEPSRRWAHFNRMIEKLRRKRRDQTKTFLFTVSHALFKSYDLVAIGDYTPDGSQETKTLRRSMSNQSLIGRFKEVLAWVAIKSGKHFHEFDERGTTRSCHSCGYVVEGGLSPSIRKWVCSECSTLHVRDENAAQNGLKKVLRNLRLEKLVPGSGRALVKERWAWCALPSGVVSTSRGLSSGMSATPRNSNGSMIASDQNMPVKFV